MNQEFTEDFFSLDVDLRGSTGSEPPPKKRRKYVRRPHDAYPTFPAVAKAIVRRVAMFCPTPRGILEPTAGEGAFVDACRETFPAAKIGAVDIDAAMKEKCIDAGANAFLNSDILTVDGAQIAKFDLIIGNLPFADSAKILKHLMEVANEAALGAILLPVSFFGWTVGSPKFPTPRDAAFWKVCRIVYFAPIAPRPSFTNDGRTDRMEYGLFLFQKGWRGDPVLGDAIIWEKRLRG